MLIELLALARNLKAQGIDTGLVHRDFDRPGVSSHATLRMILNESGEVIRLRPIAKGDEDLWTLKRGNFKYFPAARPPCPPIRLDIDDARWKVFEQSSEPDDLRNSLISCEGQIQDVDLSGLNDQTERLCKWSSSESPEVVRSLNRFALAFRRFTSSPREAATAMQQATEGVGAHAAEGVAERGHAQGECLLLGMDADHEQQYGLGPARQKRCGEKAR